MATEYLTQRSQIDYVTEPVVRIEYVNKEFTSGDETFKALDDVSFEIHRGEMIAIMGPSGSGKSTLMNLIGLLDTPTSGTYWLGDQDVSKLDRTEQANVRNSQIGFVFQSFNLLPRLTALKNVELPMIYGRVSLRERDLAAREALASVGLESKMNNLPNTLSGGQKQRVAVARALVHKPNIILADEPTGALDTRTGNEIMHLFRTLNREHGLTIIIVTHDPDIGRRMDRVIGLRDGKLSPNILREYYNVEMLDADNETITIEPTREKVAVERIANQAAIAPAS